ncbi:hypothetical protein ONZ51_g12320 [Trametes cubensis]|uniref:Uncharacterized protein n=1 Tax=Trametes cubensis TaxID=1111947 RepID=A0AAD7THF9_9APHY|nr:hypothetical protein ONZ51_g12320 [Trametes cubensis]
MREKKIAILAVQEAHLNDERVAAINNLFDRKMVVMHSEDPENGTGARGVAFAINKRIIKTPEYTIKEVIPGRALLLDIAWTAKRRLRLLNVYAPNPPRENAQMWKDLEATGPRRVDMLLGDLNMVEDSLDRLPARDDPMETVEALQSLKREWRVSDGWRRTHANQTAFTYQHTNGTTQSRLDRIYATRSVRKDADNWDLEEPGVETDHKLAYVEIADRTAPFLGKGRWVMPQHLLRDEEMKDTMKRLAKEMVDAICAIPERTKDRNPQTVYNAFKKNLMKEARKRAKVKIPKIQKRLTKLREDRDDILARLRTQDGQDAEEEANLQRRAAILQDRITRLEQKRFETSRKALATKCKVRSETLTKEWIRANYTPPDFEIEAMRELKEHNGPNAAYTDNTKKMAEIARKHYDDLQATDLVDEDSDEYRLAIQEALQPADAKLSNRHKAQMAEKITRAEVVEAIKSSATSKSPGLDGLQSEVWKEYTKWYEADVRNGEAGIDVPKALAAVFNDVMQHGTDGNTSFAQGWICPVYKLKKDKREIVNYRPITLLNSDYKLLTRALAMRLARCANEIIHPDQAGFVPGRSIYDHIRLASLAMDYAEAEEVNGAIIALDQEKAYDRIGHRYLYSALKHMNFPRNFIRAVQNLYESAESCVIVNGTRSSFFRIWRGVRQGDPLSCLLFNIAIEPLAAALRKSSLNGLTVPGLRNKLVAKLFADDTTVFLNERDDYRELVQTTEKWCKGSRAKFNSSKTEIIPLGTPEYRRKVQETRRLGEHSAPFPEGMEVGGRTQFLAKAQGMPPEVEAKVEKLTSDFVWGPGKKATINRDTLMLPVSQGGLNMLDIKARNEAIELMWLKTYLNLSENRPDWAYLADILIAKAIMAESRCVDADARINTFLQTWDCAQVAQRATAPGVAHTQSPDCECGPCTVDRIDRGCDNPPRCVRAAQRTLSRLYPKWRNEVEDPEDGLSLTKKRKEANAEARENDERITFDPSISQGLPIARAFRVFVRRAQSRKPARRPPKPYQAGDEEIELFTDGSCKNNGRSDAKAGSGIWIAPNDPRNASGRVPHNNQSNQTGEFYAVAMAHEVTPPFVAMHIVSDSKYVVSGLTKWLHRWEQIGWIGVQNADVIKDVVARLRSRSAPTTLRWVKGHAGLEGNEKADELAAIAVEQPRPYMPRALPPPTEYLKEGAELAELTQKIAYAGIRQDKNLKAEGRKRTNVTVADALAAVRAYDGNSNTKEAFWNAIRREEINKRVRDFLWKMAHCAHRVGTFWSSIPGYEHRAACPKCGVPEDMQHVLASCGAPGQDLLWKLSKAILQKRQIRVPDNITAAFVIGSPVCEVKDEDGELKTGDTRLLRIVMTETAYLIWKLRCERVIEWENNREHTAREIENRWAATLNARISHDQAMTNIRLVGKRAIAESKAGRKAEWLTNGSPTLGPEGPACIKHFSRVVEASGLNSCNRREGRTFSALVSTVMLMPYAMRSKLSLCGVFGLDIVMSCQPRLHRGEAEPYSTAQQLDKSRVDACMHHSVSGVPENSSEDRAVGEQRGRTKDGGEAIA